ncbi:MAG: aspartate aminotransferase family protein [Candidatus Hydrogenedentes bacterium]|nr:aspartate aminotransferase family protein [Candidatus Hydrogenedentota bacterium]
MDQLLTPRAQEDSLRSEGDLNVGPERRAWAEETLDETARHWLERDSRVFLHQALSTPCLNVLQHCDGSYLEDVQGRRYLDFHGNSVHQIGHANPRVIQAIVEQMQALSFCPRRYTNLPAIQLAEKLTQLAPPGLGKVLFAPGGALAIGMALKLARAATGRHKMIALWDAFHGASLDAISVSGEAIFRKGIGPLLPGVEHAPPPDPLGCPFHCGRACSLQCADYIEYILEKEGDVAAVIAETVRSTPFIPPKEYWRRVRAACDRHGALLILDEIPTCLGRTGALFACEHYGIVPDMLVLGKGLGGGIFPLAALLARTELDVMPEGALGHYTHEKSPVACAAALATLQYIEEEDLLARVGRMGVLALEEMRGLQQRFPLIHDVRGLGLLLGVELVRQDGARATEEAERILYAALRRGLSFKISMGNILTLAPPLTIHEEELRAAISILDECFQKVCAEP